MKHAAVVAGLALGMMSETAKAELLHFAYDGSSPFSVNLDSKPQPYLSLDGFFTQFRFDSDVNGNLANASGTFSLIFPNQSFGGGVSSNPNGDDIAVGDQIYSGTEDNPIFSPGVYNLEYNFHPATLTISVSTVPLPASAPMFGAALLGLAGLGYAAKRKKAAAAT